MTEQKKRGRPRKTESVESAKPSAKKPAAKKPVASNGTNWKQLAVQLDIDLQFANRDIQALTYEIGVLQSIIENMECNKSWFKRLFNLKG